MKFEELLLKFCKKEFPKGSQVITSFNQKEKHKIRIVNEVVKSPTNSQTGIFLRTEDGLFCDIAWFEKLN